MKCDYYTHNFVKKGDIVETWSGDPTNTRMIQEMECTKCGITTYYPAEAFDQNGELVKE